MNAPLAMARRSAAVAGRVPWYSNADGLAEINVSTRLSRAWVCLVVVAAGFFPLAACSKRCERFSPHPATRPAESDASDGLDHVLTTDAAYYRDSPAQGRPPDGTWKAGTRVRVRSRDGSYWRVQTEDGVEAHVSADALRAADVK